MTFFQTLREACQSIRARPMSDPLCFLAQLAGGQSCLGVDRDGEAWLKVLLSRQDAARIIERQGDLMEGFYVTLVPERQAKDQLPPSRRPAH